MCLGSPVTSWSPSTSSDKLGDTPARRVVAGSAASILRAALAAFLVSGCASYDELSRDARGLYYDGRYEDSIRLWEELKAEHPDLQSLVDLELGMVYLAAGDHERSSAALEEADRMLEVLDFSTDPSELGRYVYSESSGIYRAHPYEKVLLSAMNLLNYAARGRFPEARTEANLLYSRADGIRELEYTTRYDSALVYLLVGLLDEILEPDRPGRALAAYERAYASLPSAWLEDTIARLRVRRDTGSIGVAEAAPWRQGGGELVVVVLAGRGPILDEFGSYVMSDEERRYFQDIVLADVLARVAASAGQALTEEEVTQFVLANLAFPQLRLAVIKRRPSAFSAVDLQVAGQGFTRCERVLNLDEQVFAWFDQVRGRLVGAAISRAAFRIAMGLATQILLRDRVDPQYAALAGLLVQRTAWFLDTPDTRCWTLIPRDVFLQRRALPPGEHDVVIRLRGPTGSVRTIGPRRVTIRPGEITFLVEVSHD